MKRIKIGSAKPYEMVIGRGILGSIASEIERIASPKIVAVISDSKVSPLYAGRILGPLSDAGYETKLIEFPEGEENKDLASFETIIESLARCGLSRSDLVIALGGGVTGDMAGFAAATYLRGINYIQVPTTYLAAVDSSVGGKTAVDLPTGKNQLGAFWQPRLVLLDHETFETLTPSEFLDGSAEAFKAAMIAEPELAEHVVKVMEELSSGDDDRFIIPDEIEYVIEHSVDVKRKVVEADERDQGPRQLLNFGHTIGHSLEMLADLAMPHGHAVARGMVAESKAAYALGLTDNDVSGYIKEALERMGFDTEIENSAEEILKYTKGDKKRRGDELTVVVPESIGKCVLKKLPVSRLSEYIEAAVSK